MLVRLCAVLYGVNAVFERDAHALRTLHMRGDLVAQPVRLVTRGLDVLGRHLQRARLALHGRVQHAAGYHQLYKIWLAGSNLRDKIFRLLGAVRLIRKRACHMPAGHGDRHVRREDARADVLPGLYPVAYLAVVLHDAADGADGGDAAHELGLGVRGADNLDHAPHERGARDGLYKLGIIGLLFLRAAGGRQVQMQVYKPRHNILAAEIYLLAVRALAARGDNADYLLAVGDDAHALLRLHIFAAVEYNAVYIRSFHGNAPTIIFML